MIYWRHGLAAVAITLVALPGVGAGMPRHDNPQVKPVAAISRFAATGCDESLWGHVYKRKRLKVLARCITASGTVEESVADDDGDQHFLLRLDPGQESLVNKRNLKKKNGALVIEIVCANPVLLPKVKSACSAYTNRIPLPKAGDHVKATGAYVIDSNNGWAEIHPLSRLQRN